MNIEKDFNEFYNKFVNENQNIFDETIKQLSIELTEQLIEVFTIANNVDLSNNQIVNCLILEENVSKVKPPILDIDYLQDKK